MILVLEVARRFLISYRRRSKLKSMIQVVLICLLLSSCADGTLKAPCPNFGMHCQKHPINSWDYQNAPVF